MARKGKETTATMWLLEPRLLRKSELVPLWTNSPVFIPQTWLVNKGSGGIRAGQGIARTNLVGMRPSRVRKTCCCGCNGVVREQVQQADGCPGCRRRGPPQNTKLKVCALNRCILSTRLERFGLESPRELRRLHHAERGRNMRTTIGTRKQWNSFVYLTSSGFFLY